MWKGKGERNGDPGTGLKGGGSRSGVRGGESLPSLVRLGVALFPFLVLGWFSMVRADGSAAAETGSGPSPFPSGTLSHSRLRSDTVRQQELLRYAKGIFLARLGFGGGVAPPLWAAGVRRACFVTFFSGKRVIACSGGFLPRTPDLAREIEENVRQALHLDRRAARIDGKAARAARVLITFPGEPRPVASYQAVDPTRQGLFVENERWGVAIVPGEAKTASWAFREALRRLGERDPSRVRLFAFDAWGIQSEKRSE
ncbi:MAG: AMMECR1 domain-containing protein [Geobacteraceae bacterium]|nr:AMMECR1 domain-containing protein [Geobacteraceae bacterium]